jgi:hypothetical protein
MHLENCVLLWNARPIDYIAEFKVLTAVCVEEFRLVGCNAAQCIENQPVFRRIMSHSSSFCACYFLNAGSLLVSFFNSEDGGDVFL